MSETGHTLKPTGSLTMKEVPYWHSKTNDAQALPSDIDLSDVERTDSSALAWLLDLQSKGQQQQLAIAFNNPPQALVTLAQLSGVQALLGWDTEIGSTENSNSIEADS